MLRAQRAQQAQQCDLWTGGLRRAPTRTPQKQQEAEACGDPVVTGGHSQDPRVLCSSEGGCPCVRSTDSTQVLRELHELTTSWVPEQRTRVKRHKRRACARARACPQRWRSVGNSTPNAGRHVERHCATGRTPSHSLRDPSHTTDPNVSAVAIVVCSVSDTLGTLCLASGRSDVLQRLACALAGHVLRYKPETSVRVWVLLFRSSYPHPQPLLHHLSSPSTLTLVAAPSVLLRPLIHTRPTLV